MNLLEQYRNRLNVSEKLYASKHAGEKLSLSKKLAIAKCLSNESEFLKESFNNSVGTQAQDIGAFKRFVLNITTAALPNLIAYDLVIVKPMSARSGYVTYVKYVAGSNKGVTKQGDLFNSPFALGKADPDYTSSRVVEEFTFATGGQVKASWFPVATGDTVKPRITGITLAAGTAGTVAEDASVTVGEDGQTLTLSNGSGTALQNGDKVKVAYVYDNVIIPQNDLPLINAETVGIPLVAKARRIAVYYSQIAAYEAKQEYGFDLGDGLARQAVGRLQFEIDTEITDLLVSKAAVVDEFTFNKANRNGVSKAEHYEGFTEVIGQAKAYIYAQTQRFMANYLIVGPDIIPMLPFLKGFEASRVEEANGPYLAGTLDGYMKVFVKPNMPTGKFVVGVNGDDMMSSAAVYAPYMPIIPTQLLGHADGGMSQGFSTMYALEMLNEQLVVAGKVINDPTAQAVLTKTVD